MSSKDDQLALNDIEVTNNGTHLSIVGKDLKSIPRELHGRFGGSIQSLDLSFNQLTRLENLERFTGLKSLVVDNNEIEDVSHFPKLPHLEILWLNNNKISDIEQLLTVCETNFPKLNYLSILKNPACPNEFTGNDIDDYQRHRLFVLYRLKNLKFLDSRQVTAKERQEAERRGKFCKVVVANSNQPYQPYQTNDEFDEPSTDDSGSKHQSASYFGYTRHVYTGRHSEGNRFIKNQDL
jgi:hypothetical protein